MKARCLAADVREPAMRRFPVQAAARDEQDA